MTSEAFWDGTDVTSYTDETMARLFLPNPEGTSFINSFAHIVSENYEASYYSYVWASVLAADLASVFEASDDGFVDGSIGTRYRREILEPGRTRDAMDSVEAFLGRPYDESAYLRRLEQRNE